MIILLIKMLGVIHLTSQSFLLGFSMNCQVKDLFSTAN